MPQTVIAAVSTDILKTELQEFPMPEPGPDAGVLSVEAAGICGADWGWYQRERRPRIMGHENVGTVMKLGSAAGQRWGLKEGDRIVLEEYLPCGHCPLCRSGDFRLCEDTEVLARDGLRYGWTPLSVQPSLWGGYAQCMYLHPRTVFHRVRSDTPAHLLAMAVPLSNGMQWASIEAGMRAGKTILVQGVGQTGLACTLAAKHSGADCIIVSGLESDGHRLEVARKLGADYTITADKDDLVARVAEITGGAGVDAVIDTAGGPKTLLDGIECVKKNGIILFSAFPQSIREFVIGAMSKKRLTLKALRGHSYAAVEAAIEVIQSGRYPLDLIATNQFSLSEADLAVRSVGRCGVDAAIHVSIIPGKI